MRAATALIEAFALLLGARVAVAFLPFGVLARLAGGAPSRAPNPAADPRSLVRRSINRAARFPAPWAVCLPRAIAAHWMLRWRGVESTVCLGVRRDPEDGRMDSHAWLRTGGRILIGSSSVPDYVKVAEFPLAARQRRRRRRGTK
jgi:hypothetical protein